MAIDIERRIPVIGNNQGGLPGPAIKPIALLKVHQVYQVCKDHDIPIIGQGGVTCTEDAIEFLIAGATTVGIGTSLFYDPLICNKTVASLIILTVTSSALCASLPAACRSTLPPAALVLMVRRVPGKPNSTCSP